MDLNKLASELQGPFLKAFTKDISFDDAVKTASYNMMMLVLKDLMAKAAIRWWGAKLLFTGIPGNIFLFFVSYLAQVSAEKGFNFAIGYVHFFQVEGLKDSYIANMKVINKDVDLQTVITEQYKQEYKKNVKNQLKNFFNLSRYFKSK